MIVFSWAIAFGPNTREASGSVAYIQTALGISPVQIALVASLGAGLILALNLKGVKFLLAASPISAFYAIVVMYTLNQGFSLATPAFSMMAYLYLLRAAKE
jgi:hypothetical protein